MNHSSDVEQIRNAWVAVGLELPSDVSIYGAGALCDTRNYTHSAVPTPFTVSWQLAGEDTDSFSFTSLGDSCSVTPLVYHTNKSAVVQLSILYNGHVFKKINKKIYTHSSSLHVSGYQDDYDHLGEFYPSQIFSYDANNAANGYSSSQILINTECDITLSSSRFKGMDISFTGNNLLPSNIVHNDSCVSFHTMPYFPFPLLSPGRGGTKPLTTTEYDLAMNVTSEGGCYDFTLNFLVSNIHEHDNELSISVSGNTLYAQLLTANGESIGGGLYQDPTWYLYVIQAQTGQTVRSKTVAGTSTTVNLSGLASGIYVVRAVYDGNTYSNKFLR